MPNFKNESFEDMVKPLGAMEFDPNNIPGGSAEERFQMARQTMAEINNLPQHPDMEFIQDLLEGPTGSLVKALVSEMASLTTLVSEVVHGPEECLAESPLETVARTCVTAAKRSIALLMVTASRTTDAVTLSDGEQARAVELDSSQMKVIRTVLATLLPMAIMARKYEAEMRTPPEAA